jgi:hypothetical protein
MGEMPDLPKRDIWTYKQKNAKRMPAAFTSVNCCSSPRFAQNDAACYGGASGIIYRIRGKFTARRKTLNQILGKYYAMQYSQKRGHYFYYDIVSTGNIFERSTRKTRIRLDVIHRA